MLHAIEMGWFILNKYYALTDDAPVYAAALLLDPSKRSTYIKKNWLQEWVDPAIAQANTIWEEDYKIISIPISEEAPLPKRQRRDSNALDRLRRELAVIAETADDDDFKIFIEASPIQISCTPLEWWCHEDQRRRYPRLHCMAIAILSIPAESAEAERVFSGARRTCTWDRLRLSCANIEKIECIGSWLHQGLITPSSESGMGFPLEPDDDEAIQGFTDEIIEEIRWFKDC
jgi:hypothetical protein